MLAVAAGAGALWTARAAGAPGSIAWGQCADRALQGIAQCAYVSVPLDYANPNGQQIELAISRVRHTSRHYQGVILVNPGGPGASGLELASSLSTQLALEGFARVAGEYDWIGFDPRGVGSSKPALSCIRNYFSPDRPSYVPRTPALTSYWLSRSKAYAQACEAASPTQATLLAHMTTADLARDMDVIRADLGQQQISYYGFSYGTYLGQVYATLFPTRVRRLVLDSNVDPTKAPFQTGNLEQDGPFNRNERIWFAWLARYDKVYRLGRTERTVQRLFYTTERRLAKHPADGQVGLDEWLDIFINAAYYEETWLDLARTFSDWVHHPGRHAAGELIAKYRSMDTPGNDNSYATYLAVECTDAAWPTDWRVWQRDVSAANAAAPFIAWENAWFNAPCIYWPAPPSTPVQVNGSAVGSALLVDETLDAATPFEGSLVVRRLFPHSVLVAEPGGTSHADSLSGDMCVDGTIARYLATGRLPPRRPGARWDKTCAPLPKPVPVGGTHSARAAGAFPEAPSRRFSTAASGS